MGNVTIRDADGRTYDVPEEQAAGYLKLPGFSIEGAAERAQRNVAAANEEQYGGATGALAAGSLGALRTVTGGLSDVALAAAGGRRDVNALKAENPIASTVGELAGAFVPTGVGGLASKAGTAIRAGEGAGALATIGRGAAAGLAEGAIYGAGSGVSELALSEDPLTAEHVAGVLSSNMLLGGVAGGGIGLAGAALERGLVRAKGALDGALARKVVEDTTPDLAALDGKGLRSARDVEIERIQAERAPLKRQLIDDVQNFRELTIEAQIKKGADDLMHVGEVREANAALRRASNDLRKALDDKVGLAERPESLLKTLRTQEQALGTIKEIGDTAIQNWDATARAIPDQIRSEIIAGKVPGFVPDALTPRGVDAAVERVMLQRYGSLSGPEFPKSFRVIDDKFASAIDVNRKLQQRIHELTAEPASERLTQIEAAKDALGVPHQPSLGEHALNAAAHALGPVGTIASIGAKAAGGIKAALGSAAKRTGAVLSTFLDVGAKAVAKGTPAAVAAGSLTATEVLSRARFGAGSEPPADPKSLPELFKARSAEIREQTMVAADGSIQMRPAARMAITRQLAPVAAAHPVLADKIETAIARKVAYMSSKLPKRPEVGGIQVGPDNWSPSDLQIRSWARTVRACEDPDGVERRLAQGIVTPEEAEAYRACYPERLAVLQRQIFAAAPTLARTLPTRKKVALFVMTGVPTMPALQPNVFKVLQATFAVEPGTAGGTAAPKPMPAFGALGSAKTMDQPTPAQKRGG